MSLMICVMKLMVEVMEVNFSMHCFLYWRIIQTKILEARGQLFIRLSGISEKVTSRN